VPHDRLRFAWIVAPRRPVAAAQRAPGTTAKIKRGPAPNAQAPHITLSVAHDRAPNRQEHKQVSQKQQWVLAKERPEVPEGTAGRPRTGYSGVEEFTSSFFYPWPPPKLWRLRFGLKSSGFYSQTVCVRLVRQRERCKSAVIADQPLTRHIAALLRCGRDTRLVSSIQVRKRSIFELAGTV
jgi:hypothetical protein